MTAPSQVRGTARLTWKSELAFSSPGSVTFTTVSKGDSSHVDEEGNSAEAINNFS
ncbi:MAG: hypothetical protein Kow0089_09320 [Desulfobulbaceae bacterium]